MYNLLKKIVSIPKLDINITKGKLKPGSNLIVQAANLGAKIGAPLGEIGAVAAATATDLDRTIAYFEQREEFSVPIQNLFDHIKANTDKIDINKVEIDRLIAEHNFDYQQKVLSLEKENSDLLDANKLLNADLGGLATQVAANVGIGIGLTSAFTFGGAFVGQLFMPVVFRLGGFVANGFRRLFSKPLIKAQNFQVPSPKLTASLGAVTGGLIGGIKGGLLGSMAGPIGIVTGVLVGIFAGTTAGGLGAYLGTKILQAIYK